MRYKGCSASILHIFREMHRKPEIVHLQWSTDPIQYRQYMTKKIKMWKWKCFILVPGVRGSQPGHSGRQHLPHRLFPWRTLHEVKTEHEHKWKHRQCVCRYGSQVLKYLSHDQVARSDLPNPMCTVFPTVTRFCLQCFVQGVFSLPTPLKFLSTRKTKYQNYSPYCPLGKLTWTS